MGVEGATYLEDTKHNPMQLKQTTQKRDIEKPYNIKWGLQTYTHPKTLRCKLASYI